MMFGNFFEKYNNFFTNKRLFESTNIKDIIIFNKILKILKIYKSYNYSPEYCFLKSAAC